MLKYIREESFFNCLLWIHAALSGIIVSVLVGENVHNSNEFHTSFIFYGFCSKTHISWEESTWSYILLIASRCVIVFVTFGAQIALIKKQKELEKQRTEGIMVTIYSKDGVTISRRAPDKTSCRKLGKYNRTVVTPKASFISFLYNAICFFGSSFFYLGPSGPSIMGQFAIYVTFCVLFFLHSLIETIFSPTLSNTLIRFFLCHRKACPVVTV